MRRAAACWGYALLTSVLIVGCAEEDLQAAADAAALASANDAIDEVAAYGQTSPAGWPDSDPIRSGLAAEGRRVMVIDETSDHGDVRLDLAFGEQITRGGGLFYSSASSVTCVRLHVTAATVSAVGIACPVVVQQEWGTGHEFPFTRHSASPS